MNYNPQKSKKSREDRYYMQKISGVLNSENLKLIATIFFNLSNAQKAGQENFLIHILYKNSEYAKYQLTERIVQDNNELMRDYTDLEFNVTGKSSHKVELENDLKISRELFLDQLNTKIQQLRFKYSREEFNQIIITTIFAFRGSQDFNRNFYAVDILKENMSEKYINNLASILISLDDIKQLNINFRELQPEYIAGNARNTQLRINLKWFDDNYRPNLYPP